MYTLYNFRVQYEDEKSTGIFAKLKKITKEEDPLRFSKKVIALNASGGESED